MLALNESGVGASDLSVTVVVMKKKGSGVKRVGDEGTDGERDQKGEEEEVKGAWEAEAEDSPTRM